MKKKIVPNFIHTRPGEENSEKNSKKFENNKIALSSIIFSENGDEVGRERWKKNLVPNSVHTRPG